MPTLGHALHLSCPFAGAPDSPVREALLGALGSPLILLPRRWRNPLTIRAFGLRVQCSLPETSRYHIHEVTTPRSFPVQCPEVPEQLRALITLEQCTHCQQTVDDLQLFSFSFMCFSFVVLEWPTFNVNFFCLSPSWLKTASAKCKQLLGQTVIPRSK